MEASEKPQLPLDGPARRRRRPRARRPPRDRAADRRRRARRARRARARRGRPARRPRPSRRRWRSAPGSSTARRRRPTWTTCGRSSSATRAALRRAAHRSTLEAGDEALAERIAANLRRRERSGSVQEQIEIADRVRSREQRDGDCSSCSRPRTAPTRLSDFKARMVTVFDELGRAPAGRGPENRKGSRELRREVVELKERSERRRARRRGRGGRNPQGPQFEERVHAAIERSRGARGDCATPRRRRAGRGRRQEGRHVVELERRRGAGRQARSSSRPRTSSCPRTRPGPSSTRRWRSAHAGVRGAGGGGRGATSPPGASS